MFRALTFNCDLKYIQHSSSIILYFFLQSVEKLVELYKNVDEIDLFVGAIAERPLPGALLGPTFVCLVGDQFARLRRGDRFFYEEADQPSSFSEGNFIKVHSSIITK